MVEQQTFPNYWQDFKRPSEAQVDELLANRCDGYTDDDDTVDALALFVDWQMSDRANIATIVKRPF